jgi:23S rRNA pseudouridine2605 synthase
VTTSSPSSRSACAPAPMPDGSSGRRHRDPEHPDQGERLQKVLARVGIGSRRSCEDLIVAGRVTVNGTRAVLGQRVDVGRDEVALDGAPLPVAPGLVHYLLHKPAGVVTTARDPQGRRTVLDLVPARPRVFPVGRLDADSEGLLILTNDGALAQRLSHPSHGVAKEYLVEVQGVPAPGALRALRRGVALSDGPTAPATVGVVAPGVVRIVIHEGRNRQVRRMCEAVGHPVRRLVRTRIGPVSDRTLAPGTWRALRPAEVRALGRAAHDRPPGDAGRAPGGGRRGPG